MNVNSLLEAPSFRVGRPQFTPVHIDTHGHLNDELHDLQTRIKALEDQHREILPNSDRFICIDLGYPLKKIYVEKPRKE